MTKITITIPPSLLPYFRAMFHTFLKNPRFEMRSVSTISTLVLREWVFSKVQKLHLINPNDSAKFRTKPSEAFAIYETLIELPIADNTLQDIDRNQLIDDIARQLPQLLNQPPV